MFPNIFKETFIAEKSILCSKIYTLENNIYVHTSKDVTWYRKYNQRFSSFIKQFLQYQKNDKIINFNISLFFPALSRNWSLSLKTCFSITWSDRYKSSLSFVATIMTGKISRYYKIGVWIRRKIAMFDLWVTYKFTAGLIFTWSKLKLILCQFH